MFAQKLESAIKPDAHGLSRTDHPRKRILLCDQSETARVAP